MIKIKKIVSGNLNENCYVVYDTESLRAVIVDPGEDGKKIIFELTKNKLRPEMIINTHGHYDHVFSNDEIRLKFNVPLAIHKCDLKMLVDSFRFISKSHCFTGVIKIPEIILESDQDIKLTFVTFKVMHTPGHTDGSICLLFDDFLITGDTVFAGTIGRTDFPGGDYKKILDSVSKIKKLNQSLTIYPGHGIKTTLANELGNNPYFK
jgi:glyoxylase-like metal-dependent hydrolase (beta-lactamase superfamily II)